MSLFDELVNEALRSRAELTSLRPVVEKELLHHGFIKETRRFLPASTVRDMIEQEAYWSYLADLVDDLAKKAMAALR